MKATLEYNLDDYHDRLAHKRAISSTNAYIALFRIFEEVLRPQIKYGELKENQFEILDKVQTQCYDILEDLNLDLADLE